MPQIEPLDLLNAYCEGVFPMGDDDGSISWFRPKMRGGADRESTCLNETILDTKEVLPHVRQAQ